MRIVIGEHNDKTRNFSRKVNGYLTMEMCNLKDITEDVEIYLPFLKLLPNGVIEKTNLYFEEMLWSLNVKSIFYGAEKSNDLLKNLANHYHILLYTEESV